VYWIISGGYAGARKTTRIHGTVSRKRRDVPLTRVPTARSPRKTCRET
jgi:hypothetical protein